MSKDTVYGYHYVVDGIIYHTGITNDPDRRWEEHDKAFPLEAESNLTSLNVVWGPSARRKGRGWEYGQFRRGAPIYGYREWRLWY